MNKKGNLKIRIWAVLFWLLLWEGASLLMGQEIFLVSPIRALIRFFELIITGEFWIGALSSMGRILLGFALAFLLGTLLGALASKYKKVGELIAPLNLTIKTVPVASFVILAIICFSSKYLAVFISFLIAFPIIFTSILAGVENTDNKLLEMSRVFGMDRGRVRRYIYLPEVYKFLRPAVETGVGMAWKAGIAAEVIGIPKGSIGEKIQQAKVYLETPDLIAWTIGVVLLSLISEKVLLFIFDRAVEYLKKAPKELHHGKETTEALKGESGKIQVSNLKKDFGDEEVLKGISFDVDEGEIVAIMGPSGEGKTTLLRILAGLETPDEGEVVIEDKKEGSAFLFQEDRLLEYLDGPGNLKAVNGISEDKIKEGEAFLGLEETEGKSSENYSGGMKRRVALMRTMFSPGNPVLLDEPFKGLDEATKEKAAKFILKERRGRSIIMVTHQVEEAKLLGASRIIELG